MEPDRKTSGFCKAGSRKRFRLVFSGPVRYRDEFVSVGIRREIPHPTTARCPSRASPQPTRLRSVARTARTRPALSRKAISTAMPAKRSTCAGRGGPSRRRALRYGGWAATFSRAFAGGGGVWDPLASLRARRHARGNRQRHAVDHEPGDAGRRHLRGARTVPRRGCNRAGVISHSNRFVTLLSEK